LYIVERPTERVATQRKILEIFLYKTAAGTGEGEGEGEIELS
jgi:hypothetical protein